MPDVSGISELIRWPFQVLNNILVFILTNFISIIIIIVAIIFAIVVMYYMAKFSRWVSESKVEEKEEEEITN